MDLFVEVKSDKPFEEYDPNWLYIRVVKHVEGETYNFKTLDKLQSSVIRVNKL